MAKFGILWVCTTSNRSNRGPFCGRGTTFWNLLKYVTNKCFYTIMKYTRTDYLVHYYRPYIYHFFHVYINDIDSLHKLSLDEARAPVFIHWFNSFSIKCYIQEFFHTFRVRWFYKAGICFINIHATLLIKMFPTDVFRFRLLHLSILTSHRGQSFT